MCFYVPVHVKYSDKSGGASQVRWHVPLAAKRRQILFALTFVVSAAWCFLNWKKDPEIAGAKVRAWVAGVKTWECSHKVCTFCGHCMARSLGHFLYTMRIFTHNALFCRNLKIHLMHGRKLICTRRFRKALFLPD